GRSVLKSFLPLSSGGLRPSVAKKRGPSGRLAVCPDRRTPTSLQKRRTATPATGGPQPRVGHGSAKPLRLCAGDCWLLLVRRGRRSTIPKEPAQRAADARTSPPPRRSPRRPPDPSLLGR